MANVGQISFSQTYCDFKKEQACEKNETSEE